MLRAPRAILLTMLCVAMVQAEAVRVPAEPALRRNIGAQDLEKALKKFAQQTGLQYFAHFKGSKRSPGAIAGASPAEALQQLLKCTELKFAFLNERAVAITEGGTPIYDDTGCVAMPEVIVRSTRLHRSPNRVPINITIMSGDDLDKSGIKG